jgi:hypothetical protein
VTLLLELETLLLELEGELSEPEAASVLSARGAPALADEASPRGAFVHVGLCWVETAAGSIPSQRLSWGPMMPPVREISLTVLTPPAFAVTQLNPVSIAEAYVRHAPAARDRTQRFFC